MPLLLPNVIKTDFRFLHVHSYRNTALFLLFIIIIYLLLLFGIALKCVTLVCKDASLLFWPSVWLWHDHT